MSAGTVGSGGAVGAAALLTLLGVVNALAWLGILEAASAIAGIDPSMMWTHGLATLAGLSVPIASGVLTHRH